jgi:hypothetical protein
MAKGHKGPRMGRPKKEIDWVLLDSNCGLDASLDYCGEAQLRLWQQEQMKQINQGFKVGKIIEVNYKAIDAACEVLARRIRERFNCTFAEYRNKKKDNFRMTLRQTQKVVAVKDKNVTMLIWLGKQELGQKEKLDTTSNDQTVGGALNINFVDPNEA